MWAVGFSGRGQQCGSLARRHLKGMLMSKARKSAMTPEPQHLDGLRGKPPHFSVVECAGETSSYRSKRRTRGTLYS